MLGLGLGFVLVLVLVLVLVVSCRVVSLFSLVLCGYLVLWLVVLT